MSMSDERPITTWLHLRATLHGIEPAVWRLLKVDASISFLDLHRALRIAFGRRDECLHSFEVDGEFIDDAARRALVDALPHADPDGHEYFVVSNRGDRDANFDARIFAIGRVLREVGDHVLHLVDAGLEVPDDFEIDVEVVGVTRKPLAETDVFRHARCIDGERAAPPDGCGGAEGYAELLAILADPAHPEHADSSAALPEFDPAAFEVDDANTALATWRAHPPRTPSPPVPARTFKQRRRKGR
jgi:hypothetical protein